MNFIEKLRNLSIKAFLLMINLTFFRHLKSLKCVYLFTKSYKIKISKLKIQKFHLKRNSIKMEKNLYIDASHPNETRIVLKSNNSIEEYEFEDKII